MYWKGIIIAIVLLTGGMAQKHKADNAEVRKEELRKFEERKKLDEQNRSCPCRPGGCCDQ